MSIRSKGILYDVGILFVSNMGLQALGFIYRMLLVHFAGAEGLGVYQLVYSVYAVCHAACLSGPTMACARISAELEVQGRQELIGCLIRRVLRICFCFSGICIVLLIFCKDMLAQVLLGTADSAVFSVMLACLMLTGIENILKAVAIGCNRVQLAARTELIEQIVRIIAVAGLLNFFGNGNHSTTACLIFVGMTISECISVLLLTYVCKKSKIAGKKARVTSRELEREIYRTVFPVSGAALLNNLIGSLSTMILPLRLMKAGLCRSQAVAELGIISGIAMPLLMLPMALISSVCTVLMPEIGRAKALGNYSRIRALTRKVVSATGIIGVSATAAIVPLAPTLSRLFFAQPLRLSYVALLGILMIFCYLEMVVSVLLNGLGEQGKNVCINIAGEHLQFLLIWVMTAQPALGMSGYIAAQCIAGIAILAMEMRLLCGILNMREEIAEMIWPSCVCGAVIFLWVRVFYTFFIGVFGMQWMGVVCTCCSAALLWLLILRILDIRVGTYLKKASKSAFLWSVY